MLHSHVVAARLYQRVSWPLVGQLPVRAAIEIRQFHSHEDPFRSAVPGSGREVGAFGADSNTWRSGQTAHPPAAEHAAAASAATQTGDGGEDGR
ncbi:protein of unknown function [Blastococcus saxobsidens DD2]|uniref:Uncharacterized protein n=1 Tax=Blastococcus saxobsidens (strain DD2) TaxID=1146883 RepID=H6RQ06_BLASD|nr:protein of unknown function [Blastococcus saxobsidens DD2]